MTDIVAVDLAFEDFFAHFHQLCQAEVAFSNHGIHAVIPLVMLTTMALWAGVLVLLIGTCRIAGFLTGKSLTSYTPGTQHGGGEPTLPA